MPISVHVTEAGGVSIAAADVALQFDAKVFHFNGVSAGVVADGTLGGNRFAITFAQVRPGLVNITGSSALGSKLAFGETATVYWVSLTVKATAREGSTRFNLLARNEFLATGLSDNSLQSLTLIPEPTDGNRDDVDGVFHIQRKRKESAEAKPASNAGRRNGDLKRTK